VEVIVKSAAGIQRQLVRWSEAHALIVLAGTALAFVGASLWPVIVLAALSFATLAWRCRDGWPRPGRFDAANALTSARILAVLALPWVADMLGALAAGAMALILFALDGVDGWLARRLGLASDFGEYLDKEADAFLMLVMCLLLYRGGRLGVWIVLPGLLRYAFVVFLMLAKPPALKERRTAHGRWIYFGMISALIAAFTPFPRLYEPLVVVMSLALAGSFADGLLDLYRPAGGERKT
jgi:phosphatidylglycerophosphate synthase